MSLTGHKTEAVYRRYAIVAENDLREAGVKLAAELGLLPGADTKMRQGQLSDTDGTRPGEARCTPPR
jgi:hypothetical protein